MDLLHTFKIGKAVGFECVRLFLSIFCERDCILPEGVFSPQQVEAVRVV